jgi:DNA polymerase-4
MLDNSLNRKIIHIDMDAFMLLWSKWTIHCEESCCGWWFREQGLLLQRAMRLGNLEFDLRLVALWPKYCPEIIFVKPRFDRYKEVSSKIQKIF